MSIIYYNLLTIFLHLFIKFYYIKHNRLQKKQVCVIYLHFYTIIK